MAEGYLQLKRDNIFTINSFSVTSPKFKIN